MGEGFADEEVAVAMDKIAGNAALGQAADGLFDGLHQRAVFVIANPKIEKVAEDVYGLGMDGFFLDKFLEECGQLGVGFAQVQIGDEVNRHDDVGHMGRVLL